MGTVGSGVQGSLVGTTLTAIWGATGTTAGATVAMGSTMAEDSTTTMTTTMGVEVVGDAGVPTITMTTMTMIMMTMIMIMTMGVEEEVVEEEEEYVEWEEVG